MSYEDLMARIARDIPELAGKLDSPRIVYVKSLKKTYITFESSVLAGEKEFLKLGNILREMFPGRPLAVRIISPGLKADFLEDPTPYRQVLDDFLRRNYPMARGWIGKIGWRMEKNQLTETADLPGGENGEGLLTLVFPDDISLQVMKKSDVGPRLARAIKEIFAANLRVEMTVEGTREERLRRMREERKDATLTVTAAEMAERYGTGIAGEKEPAPKKPAGEKKPVKKEGQPEKTEVKLLPVNPEAKAFGKPIIGRSVADRPVEIRELNGESGLVVVQGEIFKLEQKELKGGEMLLVTFAVTDYTSSVLCKIFFRYRGRFMKKEEAAATPITDEERAAVKEKVDRIKEGMCVKIRGECLYDNYARDLSISVRDMVETEKEERMDTAEEKRVELHMHTNMSTMDALTPVDKLISRAAKWGHSAVAVTDHGVLQSYPAAFRAAKGKIKLIPGCEGYLIDEKPIVEEPDDRPYDGPIVVLDFESTGLNTGKARIIEIGAVKLEGGTVIDSFEMLVDPGEPLSPEITNITGINEVMLQGQPKAEEALPKLMDFIGDLPIAAHNAHFDASLLKAELKRLGRSLDVPVMDTLSYARKLYPDLKSFRLGALCKQLGVSLKNAHRAVHDATATAHCLQRMFEDAREKYPEAVSEKELNATLTGGAIGESWHIILLAKNRTGLVNLNRLVSISHLEYFKRVPHMPRHIIQKYREGLILGSACEAGELFRAVVNREDHERIKQIASFYDYLEVQPIGNNAFMLRDGQVSSEEELRDLNREIIKLGEELNIPVVATGDVHFMDPKDAIGRAIIQAGMKFADADLQPPLYFKTTNEMLEEFSYLGAEKAREIVIDNPRKIAEQVEEIKLFPKHPKGEDTFQPYWDFAEDMIQEMTWDTAEEMYGNPLPPLVEARLKKELKSIVG
ncbi:MAG: PHP domain-containing protein, partial [Clostridia bacterium]|nr:PHP domain-containing protein [Clostridia bacterium]